MFFTFYSLEIEGKVKPGDDYRRVHGVQLLLKKIYVRCINSCRIPSRIRILCKKLKKLNFDNKYLWVATPV